MTLARNWSQSRVCGSTRSEPWPLRGCGLTGVAGGDACSRWAPCASRLLSCGLSTWMHHLCLCCALGCGCHWNNGGCTQEPRLIPLEFSASLYVREVLRAPSPCAVGRRPDGH